MKEGADISGDGEGAISVRPSGSNPEPIKGCDEPGTCSEEAQPKVERD